MTFAFYSQSCRHSYRALTIRYHANSFVIGPAVIKHTRVSKIRYSSAFGDNGVQSRTSQGLSTDVLQSWLKSQPPPQNTSVMVGNLNRDLVLLFLKYHRSGQTDPKRPKNQSRPIKTVYRVPIDAKYDSVL